MHEFKFPSSTTVSSRRTGTELLQYKTGSHEDMVFFRLLDHGEEGIKALEDLKTITRQLGQPLVDAEELEIAVSQQDVPLLETRPKDDETGYAKIQITDHTTGKPHTILARLSLAMAKRSANGA